MASMIYYVLEALYMAVSSEKIQFLTLLPGAHAPSRPTVQITHARTPCH